MVEPPEKRAEWFREAVGVSAIVFVCSATGYGPVGVDEMPRATAPVIGLVLFFSITGLVGLAAATRRRSRRGLFWSSACGVALSATHLVGGAGWLKAFLVLLAPIFLLVQLYLLERSVRSS